MDYTLKSPRAAKNTGGSAATKTAKEAGRI
jgi:hypothetical protein